MSRRATRVSPQWHCHVFTRSPRAFLSTPCRGSHKSLACSSFLFVPSLLAEACKAGQDPTWPLQLPPHAFLRHRPHAHPRRRAGPAVRCLRTPCLRACARTYLPRLDLPAGSAAASSFLKRRARLARPPYAGPRLPSRRRGPQPRPAGYPDRRRAPAGAVLPSLPLPSSV